MNKNLKFKKNIFEKKKINQYNDSQTISNDISIINNFKNDLIKIKKNFGNYLSREIWLFHKNKIPPKTKRCTKAILSLSKKNTLSTYFFNNFNNKDKVELISLIKFEKKDLDNQIEKIKTIESILDKIINKKLELKILNSNLKDYPYWLLKSLKEKSINKTWLIPFLYEIQNYYLKLRKPNDEINLSGDLIINFSSKIVADEFRSKNNLIKYQKIDEKTFALNSKHIIDSTNIMSISKNKKLTKINDIISNSNYSNDQLNFLDFKNENSSIIGILDTKIPNNSPFKNLIKTTDFLKNKEIIHHGEAVSSIAMFGDKINNFDDGCGNFNVELFEIFEIGINLLELIKRIRFAISSRYKEIKIWNLSINSIQEEALENGKPTWFATQLDEIQNEFDVIIVQSAGNFKKGTSNKIKSPSDSIHSLVVSSVEDLNISKESSFSLEGRGDYYTRKPDVSFFGGSNKKQIRAIKNGKIILVQGTSFSAPFVARKLAYLIYKEKFSILEAKTLIIHSSFKNMGDKKINEKIGWGIVPNNINQIINSEDDEIRVILNENIKNTSSSFLNFKIPEENEREYSIYLTYLSSNNLNQKYGCEYTRSSISLSFGPLEIKNKKLKIKSIGKLKFNESDSLNNEILENEKKLITVYNKWKNTFCGKDIVKRYRKSYRLNYGFLAKINKRMNIIKTPIEQDFVCVLTLKNKNGDNHYKEFLNLNRNNLNLDFENEIVLKGKIKLE